MKPLLQVFDLLLVAVPVQQFIVHLLEPVDELLVLVMESLNFEGQQEEDDILLKILPLGW